MESDTNMYLQKFDTIAYNPWRNCLLQVTIFVIICFTIQQLALSELNLYLFIPRLITEPQIFKLDIYLRNEIE